MKLLATAKDVISGALVAAGMNPVDDPFGSSDPAVVQMCTLLNQCLDELGAEYEWPHLMALKQFTTAPSDTGEYDLPTDFDRMVKQTGWTQTDSVPLGGPVTAQVWQQFRNTDFTSNFYIYFREEGNKFWVWPQPPPSGKVVEYKYLTRNFVKDGSTYTDSATAAGNQINFDKLLVIRLLKLRFLEARGFDTTAAAAQYTDILNLRKEASSPAPVLNIAARRTVPLISVANIPESGYG